ncbi:DUF6153 family protein [Streptomyces sp. NPDC059866]|uniref:DUF6153 family protein n=1 Tax=Streptomyces sp. NPDC059866 TaxID=3346978 RepID=UPI003659B12B
MTSSTNNRPDGRLLVLLVIAVLAGVLGMHALSPGGAPAAHGDTGYELVMGRTAAVQHASGGCSHTDVDPPVAHEEFGVCGESVLRQEAAFGYVCAEDPDRLLGAACTSQDLGLKLLRVPGGIVPSAIGACVPDPLRQSVAQRRQRPGKRSVISCRTQPLPSGSLKVAYEP